MKVMTEELKYADLFPEEAGKLAQRLHIKKDEIPFIRKSYTSEKSEVKPGERAVISYISTVDKDRDGEQLLPDGVQLDNYRKNPVVLWGHKYDAMPIGKNLWIKQDEKGLIAKTVFAKSEKADEVFRAYTEDIANTGPLLKAFSVGFIPVEWEDTETKELEKNKDLPKRIYKKWELLEYSTVPIPSCPEALTLAVEKNLIPESMKKALDKYIEVEDFQEEVEIENETKTMTPDELKEHYRKEQMIELVGDEEDEEIEVVAEKSTVTKPETTDNYHRIPVSSGHEDHKIRTITVSAKKGIKALYCVDCKKVKTYLFDTSKWTMEEAREWVDSHKGILERFELREARQDGDEPDLQDAVNELVESGVDVEDLAFDDAGDLVPDEVEEKRFDLEGNPSVWDIMDAIGLVIRTPQNSKTYRYVTDLYPVKYPDGHVIIEESSEKTERKYFLHPYEYDEGEIKLGESKELEATYKPKERDVGDKLTAKVQIADLPEIQEILGSLKDQVAEIKEGRVLSRKHRNLVKDCTEALLELLKADATGSREDEDKEEVEDEKEVEVEVEKGEYSEEELQAMVGKAIKKAVEGMDMDKAIDTSIKKLKGKVE